MATDETDLDIVDVLNTVFPCEKHLPGMRYCGPGTRLDLRVDDHGEPLPGNEPIDRLDKAALKHDLAYSKYSDLKQRNIADREMLRDLLQIERPTCRERLERCLVIPIMLIKSFVGYLILRLIQRT
jgi:Phospholipase A2-like domain